MIEEVRPPVVYLVGVDHVAGPHDRKEGRVVGGRNKNWHRRWKRDGENLTHDSGLVMVPAGSAAGAQWRVDANALQAWLRARAAAGQHAEQDTQAHLQRLVREAEMWRDR